VTDRCVDGSPQVSALAETHDIRLVVVPSLLDLLSKERTNMDRKIATRWCRVVAVALACSTVLVANSSADPVTVTSGHFQFGRAPTAGFTFSGPDGFFLDAGLVPVGFVMQTCAATGCRPGDVVNLSTVAGAGSGGNRDRRLPATFTLGTASSATVNGTEFATGENNGSFLGNVGLAGSFRFDTPPFVLRVVPPSQSSPFTAPFVFNGHVTGFRMTDDAARTPLFDVTLTGHGTGFSDFEEELSGVFKSDIFRFTFEATPAVPEPATLALFGTGLFGLIARARPKRR
jgi:hypothetical protein